MSDPTRSGLCAMDDHDRCAGRVYTGHNGNESTYTACECDCHHESRARELEAETAAEGTGSSVGG